MSRRKPKQHVWVLYEGPSDGGDNWGKIHGVYGSRALAADHRFYLRDKKLGHIAILKFTIRGDDSLVDYFSNLDISARIKLNRRANDRSELKEKIRKESAK